MNRAFKNAEWRPITGGLIWARPISPRVREFADRYRRGETLAEIGASVGISRERVRQLLVRVGIDGSDGGGMVKTLLRVSDKRAARAAADEAKERRCLQRWGMTREQFKEHVATHGRSGDPHSALRKYIQQRRNATRLRGIEWRMTFAEWWRIWQESGHWHERGRGQGYCMARYGDSGPYSPENVYICTIGQNFSDSYLVDHPRRPKAKHPGLAIARYKVRDGYRWQVKPLPTAKWRGGFPSKDDALNYAFALRAA